MTFAWWCLLGTVMVGGHVPHYSSGSLKPRCLACPVVGTNTLSLMYISIPKGNWEMQNVCVCLDMK